ncbi:MAG TPA: protein arginine kinase [Candidatus Latescibacteria bacterium]|nr:protein arginine kinase [Candidatus Latescibacterota bacterium]
MTLDALVRQTPMWLDASGAYADVIVSSRVRLARNLRHIPFSSQNKTADEERVVDEVLSAAQHVRDLNQSTYFDMKQLEEHDRQLLVERHLISPALALRGGNGGVMVDQDERLSIMVNEEDHLRLQALTAGFEPQAAWQMLDKVDTELCGRLDIAYDADLGYLTACPTNVGTGLRASILIHLPGLVLVQTVDQVLNGIAQVGLTVRGFYGEGTEVVGSLFQISNQITLGKSEHEILETLERVVRQIIDFEYSARQTLLRDARAQIEDKIWRSWGILANARVLSGQEFMNLASAVRLGVSTGVLKEPSLVLLNELLVRVQPSHIQRMAGSRLDSDQRDQNRAKYVRERFASTTTSSRQTRD